MIRGILAFGWACTAFAGIAAAQTSTATGSFVDAEGADVGTVPLTETPSGFLVLRVQATSLSPGWHGIHLHETGQCEGPTFESAGDHADTGEHQHGVMNAAGPHTGDLPNVHVAEDGTLTVELFAHGANLGGDAGGLLDDDGAALIIHASADDLTTDPAGESGDRIACAVIEAG